jgi:hypothetical protein
MQANYISAKELEAELLKVNFDNARRTKGAGATDDLLQLLRMTRRAARSMRTKEAKQPTVKADRPTAAGAEAETKDSGKGLFRQSTDNACLERFS